MSYFHKILWNCYSKIFMVKYSLANRILAKAVCTLYLQLIFRIILLLTVGGTSLIATLKHSWSNIHRSIEFWLFQCAPFTYNWHLAWSFCSQSGVLHFWQCTKRHPCPSVERAAIPEILLCKKSLKMQEKAIKAQPSSKKITKPHQVTHALMVFDPERLSVLPAP